jgi:argininosuccinate lyase
MEKFNESLWFDKRMWAQDIRGSVAYAKAIGKVGIITDEEVALLVKGLGEVHKEWEEGKFEIKAGDEGMYRGWVVLKKFRSASNLSRCLNMLLSFNLYRP